MKIETNARWGARQVRRTATVASVGAQLPGGPATLAPIGAQLPGGSATVAPIGMMNKGDPEETKKETMKSRGQSHESESESHESESESESESHESHESHESGSGSESHESHESESRENGKNGSDMALGIGGNSNVHDNSRRRTFLYFGNTEQDPRNYACCATYANAFAGLAADHYQHAAHVIFGGDDTDIQYGAGGERWMDWMRKEVEAEAGGVDGAKGSEKLLVAGGGPNSTSASLRQDGHVCVLGNRDVNKVRLMPYAEIPPSYPPPPHHGGSRKEGRRLRCLMALAAPTLVHSSAWTVYNRIVARAFGSIPSSVSRDKLNALIFCKLVLLCRVTMGKEGRSVTGCDGPCSGFVASIVYMAAASIKTSETISYLIDLVTERITLIEPTEAEQEDRKIGRPDEAAKVRTEWHEAQTVDRTSSMIDEIVDEVTARDKSSPEGGCIDAMKMVVDAVHRWVSPDGAMYSILTGSGRLVHIESGTSEYNRPWRLAVVHAGTEITGAYHHDHFRGECLYKLPTGYDEGEHLIDWTPMHDLSQPAHGGERSHSLEAWASQLNELYRQLVVHFYKNSVDGTRLGFTFDLEGSGGIVENDEASSPKPGRISFEWNAVVSILGRIGGVGTLDESTGPPYTTRFEVPGAHAEKQTPSQLLTDYADTDTMWFVGHHSHPTSDRRIANQTETLGNKLVWRCDTQLSRPSFAIMLATDCEQWYHHMVEAVDRVWDGKGSKKTPRFESSVGIIEWIATGSGFDLQDWDELIVGPEVHHYGRGGRMTRARVLIWSYSHENPTNKACLFIDNDLLDGLVCDAKVDGFPLETLSTGVLCLPFANEVDGMGEFVLMYPNRDVEELAPTVKARASASVQRLEAGEVFEFDGLMETHLVTYGTANQRAACMGYCSLGSDPLLGLHIRPEQDESGRWEFVCVDA